MRATKQKLFILLLALFFMAYPGSRGASAATYTYDNLNRLIKVVHASGYTEQFTYDAMGNRLSRVITSPVIGVAPTALTFATTNVGSTSPSQTLTVANSGTGPLYITTVSLDGASPGDFAITDDTCSGLPLAPTATCTIEVQFVPTDGGTRNATLAIQALDPHSPTVAINLTGAGHHPGDLNNDDSLDLKDVILGLQIQSGQAPSEPVYKIEDLNGNGRLDLPEVINALQHTGGVK